MKVLTVFLLGALAVSQAAETLLPRKVLYPRAPVPQGPGYFTPKKLAPSHSTKAFCGTRNEVGLNKIVGGDEAAPGEFPWQVAVRIDGKYFCGGSLIDDSHVLTAGHCADGATSFQLTFGAYYMNQTEPSQVVVNTTEYTMNPNWNSVRLTGDLAIIKFSPITFTPRIQPICLVGADAPDFVGIDLLVSGWGLASDASTSIAPVMRKVIIPGIANDVCKQSYPLLITDAILCCDSTGGKGSCNGDSGGPLSFIQADGTFNQVGIVSFGSSLGCEAGKPDCYTRISSYTQFIADNTGLII